MPCSRIWGHDIGIAGPGLAAETMRIFEETELQAVKLAVLPLVGPETVPCILELRVVAAEIQALILSQESKAVHENLGTVFHILLAEELFRLLVRR